MKFFIKTVCFIFMFLIIFLFNTQTFSKNTKIKYSKDSISNYFSGVVSLNQNYTTTGFKFLKKVEFLKNSHSNYNTQFIRTLVLLEKFDQAFAFSKSLWTEDKILFEIDLLLGLESFINQDYESSKKYFKRLNKFYDQALFYENFLGNILLSWNEASKGNKEESIKYFNKIPKNYKNLKKIQYSFLNCYFDTPKTKSSFEKLTNEKKFSFSRYSFFLANYLLHKNKKSEAKNAILNGRKIQNTNLLIKQAEDFILSGNIKKITEVFNCQNPKDVIAEIFYVIANLYSTEENYQLSNFYLKISFFLNEKFKFNKILIAENFWNQKKYDLSKEVFDSLKSTGSVYSWHASVSSAVILTETKGKKKSVSSMQKAFDLLSNPNFEHYYDLANFYKDLEYFEESVNYYSLALENITQDHYLIPKILDRRGTSYERLDKWKLAEKDLMRSIEILPNQAYVLNYLGYTWIDKGINIDEAFEMVEKATNLKQNDGYIIDSLGWAYYAKKNYIDAEKFLRRAVELKPFDPIINDHYADSLWMLKKNIQARYFWRNILLFNEAEEKLKENVEKKLIFGIEEKL